MFHDMNTQKKAERRDAGVCLEFCWLLSLTAVRAGCGSCEPSPRDALGTEHSIACLGLSDGRHGARQDWARTQRRITLTASDIEVEARDGAQRRHSWTDLRAVRRNGRRYQLRFDAEDLEVHGHAFDHPAWSAFCAEVGALCANHQGVEFLSVWAPDNASGVSSERAA